MNFDKRLNTAMEYLLAFNARPPIEGTRVVPPGVDEKARETIIALQAQIEAVQRGMATIHGWIISSNGGRMKGTQLDEMLTAATDIKAPEFPQAVLAEAASQVGAHKATGNEDDEDESDDDGDGVPRLRKTKPTKPASVAAHQAAHSSGRKQRGPKLEQPATLSDWLHRLTDATGLHFKHSEIMYRHLRFEQPKLIFLLDSDADHKKLINWTHSKILDYAVQYGTEEGTEQNWVSIPAAALAQLGLAVPNNGGGLNVG